MSKHEDTHEATQQENEDTIFAQDEEISDLNQEVVTLRLELRELTSEIQSLKSELVTLRAQHADILDALHKLHDKISGLQLE